MTGGPFVLAAGGTGGHLFPAQALAAELLRRGRRVVVMTDGRGHNYASAFPGAEIATVPAATIGGRSPLNWLKSVGIITRGIFDAKRKLKALGAEAVIGFGGYPSLPVMLAARIARIPSALHEQNAVLGRVNRLVAPFVDRIAAAFPFARKGPKDASRVSFIGNPVRDEVIAFRATPYVAPDEGPIRILVFGGSQGARSLSEIVPAALAGLSPTFRSRLVITQQCRPEDLARVEAFYASQSMTAEVARFFPDLPKRMVEAHLVIARSGASTLGELTVIGRPAILIPYPHAMDDHQAANAAVLEAAKAAWVVKEATLDAAKLGDMLEQIVSNPASLSETARHAHALGHPDAAARLADIAESLGRPKLEGSP